MRLYLRFDTIGVVKTVVFLYGSVEPLRVDFEPIKKQGTTMDPSALRKVQLAQLEIAKEIKRVCEENDIEYFLDSGTLLGAVRHRGFIPWDDDMDFGMTREAYERFLQIAPRALREEFHIQTWETDPYFPQPFCKVCKKNTSYVETLTQYSKSSRELFVDVFPYNVYPDAKWKRWRQKYGCKFYRRLLDRKCGYCRWASRRGLRRFVKILQSLPSILLAPFFSKEFLRRRCEALMTKYNGETSEFVCAQTGVYGRWVVPKKCARGDLILRFEDDDFACPSEYDAYLTAVYGDYMTPPPMDQRENKHAVLEVQID